MHDVMRAVKPCTLDISIRPTSCIKYLINRIFNNNLWYNVTGIVLGGPAHSNQRALLHQINKFRPNRAIRGKIITRSMQFQDGSRVGAVLLPVSYLMSLQSSEVQNLSANQISSTYLNLRLRYNYFRLDKQTSATLEFSFRLLLRSYHGNRRDIPHQATKFVQIGPPAVE